LKYCRETNPISLDLHPVRQQIHTEFRGSVPSTKSVCQAKFLLVAKARVLVPSI
jgi:hypothetical protein